MHTGIVEEVDGTAVTRHIYGDIIGSMRLMTDAASGSTVAQGKYTAFGEFIDGDRDRYGYAGAYGYQGEQAGEMPFLHVGHRYYDPSCGRFLQRDPLGIDSRPNVYAYARNRPTTQVDPRGTLPLIGGQPTHHLPNRDDHATRRPRPPSRPNPGPHIPEPLNTYHKIEATLILAGPGFVAACIGDTILIATGVPLWYDGEGSEVGYCTKRICKQIGDTWR